MRDYIVLYRPARALPVTPPSSFAVRASDEDAAEQRCLYDVPGCEVLWVHQGASAAKAMRDYWNTKAGA